MKIPQNRNDRRDFTSERLCRCKNLISRTGVQSERSFSLFRCRMGEVLSVATPPSDPVNNNTWWGKAKSMAGGKPEETGGMEQVLGRCRVATPHTR